MTYLETIKTYKKDFQDFILNKIFIPVLYHQTSLGTQKFMIKKF